MKRGSIPRISCSMLRKRSNVIDQIPPICFRKSFAIRWHGLFPGCNLPEERPVGFTFQLWIGEPRRVNVQLNHGRPIGVSALAMTHEASFRIYLLAGSNGALCWCDWILFRRTWRRADPLPRTGICSSYSATSVGECQQRQNRND